MHIRLAATLILVSAGAAPVAHGKKIVVPWADLAVQVNGMKMSAVLKDGIRVEGRAISVEPDGLVVMVRKSSDPARYQGRSLLPRAAVSTIRVSRTGWKWKLIGPIVGFVGMGTLGGAIGGRVDRGGFIISDGAAYGILAGMAAGVVTGILIGRWADHHYTTIEISP